MGDADRQVFPNLPVEHSRSDPACPAIARQIRSVWGEPITRTFSENCHVCTCAFLFSRYSSITMRVKFHFLTPLVLVAFLLSLYFLQTAFGPSTLTPPPNWPLTEESRKNYDPFSDYSKTVCRVWVNDTINGH